MVPVIVGHPNNVNVFGVCLSHGARLRSNLKVIILNMITRALARGLPTTLAAPRRFRADTDMSYRRCPWASGFNEEIPVNPTSWFLATIFRRHRCSFGRSLTRRASQPISWLYSRGGAMRSEDKGYRQRDQPQLPA
jgi:hypothetical protein